MPYQQDAKKILLLFLDRLQNQEKKEFLLLANQWESVQGELDSLILKLASQENLSEDKLFRLALYKQFQEQAEQEIKKYSNIAAGIISTQQKIYGKAGIESAQKMIGLKVGFFNKLPVETINNFIGKSFFDGAKLDQTLFARSYPDYMSKVKTELLHGIALGRGARETARQIKKTSTAPLWQSLRLARTEQMQIYRETSFMQMKASG